jgi:hypothetical protein
MCLYKVNENFENIYDNEESAIFDRSFDTLASEIETNVLNTYAIMIFYWGDGEGLQIKIINQSNKNDEAFVCSFNAICIIFYFFFISCY